MKKLYLLFTLFCFKSFAEPQSLKAPFAEVIAETSMKTSGQLVIPPLVADSVYRDTVAEDCRQYQETKAKYLSQLSSTDLTSLVTAPMPYSMKKTYEAELVFAVPKKVDLKENGELIVHHNGQSLSLNWDDDDLLKNVLNPMDSVLLTESSATVKIKITRRDLFCSFLNGNLKLKMESTVYWKLASDQQKASDTNLKLLIKGLDPVMNLEKGDKLIAALLGRAIYIVSGQPEFRAEKNFKTVEYIWNLMFENENSLTKTDLWSAAGSGVYLQDESAVLELGGLL